MLIAHSRGALVSRINSRGGTSTEPSAAASAASAGGLGHRAAFTRVLGATTIYQSPTGLDCALAFGLDEVPIEVGTRGVVSSYLVVLGPVSCHPRPRRLWAMKSPRGRKENSGAEPVSPSKPKGLPALADVNGEEIGRAHV